MTAKSSPFNCPLVTADNYDWKDSTGHYIAMAHHSLRRALEAELARRGDDVSSAQWLILMILAHSQDVTAADLAKRLNQDPGSMTRLLDRLEEKSLITRTRAADDRRRVLIELTDTGRALAPSLPDVAVRVTNQALAGFTPGEHQQLNALLQRVIDNVRTQDPGTEN